MQYKTEPPAITTAARWWLDVDYVGRQWNLESSPAGEDDATKIFRPRDGGARHLAG